MGTQMKQGNDLSARVLIHMFTTRLQVKLQYYNIIGMVCGTIDT